MMQRVSIIMLYFCSFLAVADDTVLKLYRPFGEALDQMSLTIKNKVTGECVSQSKLIVREDAWRCQVESTVYDPCFVKPVGNKIEVLCPKSPWDGESIQIAVSVPLNNEQHVTLDMSRAYPWGIELLNGEQCQAIDVGEVYDGMPVRYRCSGQNVLMGYLQRCKTVWSMLERTPEGVRTVDFKRVWF